ncbi:MAG: threonylcarbamoyl-AMP synthase [Candidatus Omnitrophica bacterium]|nr:threonylcarbamoyl-AMP synthase [Candidatus Omnitrophota bacterium]
MKTATTVLSLQEGDPRAAIREAARLLREGGLVAFPTETVYGLGVHLENQESVKRLYEVKGRPEGKELTLAISKHSDLKKYDILLDPFAETLAKRFWPGPLTLILRNEKGEKMGVRMPGHPIAQRLIEEAAVPIGLPSANPSGENPPRSAEEVLAYFQKGEIDLILDGGKTKFGTSSTVVDCSEQEWTMVREGAISKKEIEKACRG